jgi:hypothetical protein
MPIRESYEEAPMIEIDPGTEQLRNIDLDWQARSPRVARTTPISTPAAAYLAVMPPAMNVSSSG